MQLTLHEFIKGNEGLKLKPYSCTEGKLTIGYGRNLIDKGVTAEEADYLFANDLKEACDNVKSVLEINSRNLLQKGFTHDRHMVLIDMMFNLGLAGFMKFRKMIDAIIKGDWESAANEAENSLWFKQVGKRAKRNVEILRKGEMPK